jgi:hypothetical protein
MDTNTSLLKRQLTPKELIGAALIGSLVIANIVVMMLFLLPEWKSVNAGHEAVALKEQELQQVKTQYSTEQLTTEALNEMLVRVPVKRTDSDNIIFFTDLASSSKTMLGYVKQAAAEENGQSANAGSGGSAVTSHYDLLVLGHMPALLTFMEKLQEHPRLFSLTKWGASEITRDTASSDYPDLFSKAFIDKNKPVYAMQMSVDAYAFPQLQQAFSELDKKQ